MRITLIGYQSTRALVLAAAMLQSAGATVEWRRDAATIAKEIEDGRDAPDAVLTTDDRKTSKLDDVPVVYLPTGKESDSDEAIRNSHGYRALIELVAPTPPEREIPLPRVADLEEALNRIDDLDEIAAMQARDDRQTAQPIYEARLDALTAS